jgi:hypothetical protein
MNGSPVIICSEEIFAIIGNNFGRRVNTVGVIKDTLRGK